MEDAPEPTRRRGRPPGSQPSKRRKLDDDDGEGEAVESEEDRGLGAVGLEFFSWKCLPKVDLVVWFGRVLFGTGDRTRTTRGWRRASRDWQHQATAVLFPWVIFQLVIAAAK